MPAPIAYSFKDITASIKGPGGSFSLSDEGVADEGITVAMIDDKTSMVTGASGDGMHSLHAAKAGRVTIRILQNSPNRKRLNDMYNFQSESSARTGQNTIVVSNPLWGDDHICQYGAFVKQPDFTKAKDGGILEWVLNFILVDTVLGDGSLAT